MTRKSWPCLENSCSTTQRFLLCRPSKSFGSYQAESYMRYLRKISWWHSKAQPGITFNCNILLIFETGLQNRHCMFRTASNQIWRMNRGWTLIWSFFSPFSPNSFGFYLTAHFLSAFQRLMPTLITVSTVHCLALSAGLCGLVQVVAHEKALQVRINHVE